jgi:rod shape-determining protein MreD
MAQAIKMILLVLGSVILQTSLVANLSIFGNKPSLPLALTVSIALLKGSFYGELFGFFSGLLCDLSSGGPFLGIQSLSQALVGYLAGLLRRRFYSDNVTTQLMSGFTATLVDKLIAFFTLGILLSGSYPQFRLLGLLINAVVNSIMTIIVFRFLTRIFKSDSQQKILDTRYL